MSISKLNLSLIKTFNKLAEDTSGLLLCCTTDDNGEPQVHRVIATKSMVGLLCELRRPSSREQRRVLNWQWSGKASFSENNVYVKAIKYDINDLPTYVSSDDLRETIVEYNLFSVEQAIEIIDNNRQAVKAHDFETLLENLNEKELDSLKSFVIHDEELCNDIIESVMKRLKM
jgi:hypothetical protein